MKKAMRMFFLLQFQYLINIFIDILCFFDLFQLVLRLWHLYDPLTAVAKSIIAFPAIKASSWLSLISILIIWTGLLNSPPRNRRSAFSALQLKLGSPRKSVLPSQTESKHLSSQVMTISATVLLSCHRSGASLIFLFRSNIGSNPLAVYLDLLSSSIKEEMAMVLTVEDPWNLILRKWHYKVFRRHICSVCLLMGRVA